MPMGRCSRSGLVNITVSFGQTKEKESPKRHGLIKRLTSLLKL